MADPVYYFGYTTFKLNTVPANTVPVPYFT
jgi:hypothetical protein